MTLVAVQVRHVKTRVLRDISGEGNGEEAAVAKAREQMLPDEEVVRVKPQHKAQE
jgi:hypothetical protein